MQADVVVMRDVGVFGRERLCRWRMRGVWSLSSERFVPTFDFSGRLGMVGRSSDVGHARDSNESLKSLDMNCGPCSLDRAISNSVRHARPGKAARQLTRSAVSCGEVEKFRGNTPFSAEPADGAYVQREAIPAIVGHFVRMASQP
jgi:hypothetical protein